MSVARPLNNFTERIPQLSSIYLRLSVTDNCNLRCIYCRPEKNECVAPKTRPALTPQEFCELVLALNRAIPIRKIRFTGGEPLIYPRLEELIALISAKLPNAELCLTTNGCGLANRTAELKKGGLKRINISLDSIEEDKFHIISRGGLLKKVVAGISAAKRAGFERIKINTVLLRSLNGEQLTELVRFAGDNGCEIRFIELMPFGEGGRIYSREFLPAVEAMRRLKANFEYLGERGRSGTSVRHIFRESGREIAVGFITPVSHPFCGGCDRFRLDCRGWLFSCLRFEKGVDLFSANLAGGVKRVEAMLRRAIDAKRPPGFDYPEREMWSIGG
ncbi:MAG: GTP 3',8-cyclase MoaA [Myxococcota bacterium]